MEEVPARMSLRLGSTAFSVPSSSTETATAKSGRPADRVFCMRARSTASHSAHPMPPPSPYGYDGIDMMGEKGLEEA